MKKTLFLFLCFSILMASCSWKKDKLQNETPEALNTIAIIVDDQLWNGEVGDSIRNKFASPVLGLPQEEPLFTINQYPVKLFDGFNSFKRNIIIIKKGNENKFELKKNEFTTPQNVFYLTGKSTNGILAVLNQYTPFMIQKMRAVEIEQNIKTFKDSLLNTNNIQTQFGIDLLIPSTYEYAVNLKKFIWVKKEIISGNTSIVIYEVPWNTIKKNNIVNDIIRIRDSIGEKHIHGSVYGTKMITEEAYSPYFFKTSLAGYDAYETKGTWQMKNDYMSGPFINYTLFDKPNKRIIILEGFCYAPSKGKRDLMMELESIIKSVQFNK